MYCIYYENLLNLLNSDIVRDVIILKKKKKILLDYTFFLSKLLGDVF